MKNVLLFFSLILLSAPSANAQWWSSSQKITGNKEVVSQTRSVPGYERISVTGMMEVQLVAGREGKIDIEAESNLMEYIETEVNGGHLKISVKKGFNIEPSRNYPIRVVVTFEEINNLALTGSGHIRNNDPIKTRDFKISVTGSGNMNLNLETDNLEGTITGSGDVKLKGSTTEFTCKVTGSGDFLAYDLQANRVDAHVTGSGDIQVHAVQELNARVSGSGDIKYKGNPERQNFSSTGSGKVSRG